MIRFTAFIARLLELIQNRDIISIHNICRSITHRRSCLNKKHFHNVHTQSRLMQCEGGMVRYRPPVGPASQDAFLSCRIAWSHPVQNQTQYGR